MADTIKIELNENTLKKLVYSYLQKKLGDIKLKESDVIIEVKSKNEWEKGSFRARLDIFISSFDI